MSEVRYYWNIDTLPAPNLSKHSVEDVCQKLHNKFGSGEMLVVGDSTRLTRSGSITLDMNTIPFVTFIHVPSGKRNAGDKVLLDKAKEISWKKEDIIVLLSADGELTSEIMKLKTKGVVINLVGNRMFIKTEEMGGLSKNGPISSRVQIAQSEKINAERLVLHKLDDVTKTCCRKSSNIPTNCYHYCSFGALNTTTIVDLAINTSPCKMNKDILTEMMSCMTFKHNHTPCCKELNVDKTEAGGKCMDFCKGNLEFGPLMDVHYFPCLEMLEQIMFCYKKHATEQL